MHDVLNPSGAVLGVDRDALSFIGQHVQPPIPAGDPVPLVAAEQIAFANDADEIARLVHDWNRADPFLHQHARHLANSGAGRDGDDILRHDIKCGLEAWLRRFGLMFW